MFPVYFSRQSNGLLWIYTARGLRSSGCLFLSPDNLLVGRTNTLQGTCVSRVTIQNCLSITYYSGHTHQRNIPDKTTFPFPTQQDATASHRHQSDRKRDTKNLHITTALMILVRLFGFTEHLKIVRCFRLGSFPFFTQSHIVKSLILIFKYMYLLRFSCQPTCIPMIIQSR